MFAHQLIRAGYENETPDELAAETAEARRLSIVALNHATCRRAVPMLDSTVAAAMAPIRAAKQAADAEARLAFDAIHGARTVA